MRAVTIARAVFTALLLALVASPASSIDYAREQRWADEITPGIVIGDPIHLALPSGRKFLAIYEQPTKPRAAVIVVHGAGLHPDWGLINVLRSKLPESGYATLAVQMPVLAAEVRADGYGATLPEATARLAVAVEFLRGKGHARIAIVAHSLGATMSNHFLAATPAPRIDAWASLGINTGEFVMPERLQLPVLDLYGERDFPAVLAGVARRGAVLQKLRGSAQVQVAGADHFFAGHEDAMVRWVREFLDRALKS